MSDSPTRECLSCGMAVPVPPVDPDEPVSGCFCPKCDSDLFARGDGSVLTEDIAHGRETVSQALVKMDRLLREAHAGYYSALRLVVGGGVIREEVMGQLAYWRRRGRILDFSEETGNRGAVLIRIRD